MIQAVFLASGRGLRFSGGGKLLYPVEGVPMAERAFRALPPEISGLVVTEDSRVAALARQHKNLAVVENPGGGADVALTIRRGTAALSPAAEGALFCVCDQPWLTRTSVERLIEAFRSGPDGIYVLSAGGRSGNPCLFARRFFPELMALPQGKGGKELVRRHPEAARYVEAASPRELEDMDYRPE